MKNIIRNWVDAFNDPTVNGYKKSQLGEENTMHVWTDNEENNKEERGNKGGGNRWRHAHQVRIG